MKVAVIGLGTMGMGAALNLVRKGHQVIGCDVREAARAELAAAGGTAVGSARPSCRPTPRPWWCSWSTPRRPRTCCSAPQGCLAQLAKGSGDPVLRHRSRPRRRARSDAKIAAAGFLMLDAPVSGGKAGAQAGTMTVMASGSDAAFAKAQPVLDAISTKVWRLGRRGRHRQHGEDGEPVAGRRAHRHRGRGAGARASAPVPIRARCSR